MIDTHKHTAYTKRRGKTIRITSATFFLGGAGGGGGVLTEGRGIALCKLCLHLGSALYKFGDLAYPHFTPTHPPSPHTPPPSAYVVNMNIYALRNTRRHVLPLLGHTTSMVTTDF